MFNNDPDATAIAQAKAEERARIKAIIDLPEAQSRQTLAIKLAVDSDMNLAAAKATLAGTAPEPAVGAQPAPGADATARVEIGPGGDASAISADRAKAGWAKAIGAINAGVTGVVQVR